MSGLAGCSLESGEPTQDAPRADTDTDSPAPSEDLLGERPDHRANPPPAPTEAEPTEAELIDEAFELAVTDASGAYRVLDAHEVRFPRGPLARHREALRAELYLADGDCARARLARDTIVHRLGDRSVAESVDRSIQKRCGAREPGESDPPARRTPGRPPSDESEVHDPWSAAGTRGEARPSVAGSDGDSGESEVHDPWAR